MGETGREMYTTEGTYFIRKVHRCTCETPVPSVNKKVAHTYDTASFFKKLVGFRPGIFDLRRLTSR